MSRNVLVTGGTGPLGVAVVQRFLDDGHRVAVTSRQESRARRLRDELGASDRMLAVEADVTEPAAVTSMVERVASEMGPIEVLVHLIGGWKGGEPVHEQSLETWDHMITAHLVSAFLCCRAVLPAMYERDWGRIVLVSSRTARSGRGGQSAYAIAKAGVSVLAETIAEEARGTGVTANVIAPSTIDTPDNRAAMPGADHSSWVPASELASAIAFLSSDAAGALRGAWLSAYGSA